MPQIIKQDKYKWYNYLMSKSIDELKELLETINNQILTLGLLPFLKETKNKLEIVISDKIQYYLLE